MSFYNLHQYKVQTIVPSAWMPIKTNKQQPICNIKFQLLLSFYLRIQKNFFSQRNKKVFWRKDFWHQKFCNKLHMFLQFLSLFWLITYINYDIREIQIYYFCYLYIWIMDFFLLYYFILYRNSMLYNSHNIEKLSNLKHNIQLLVS